MKLTKDNRLHTNESKRALMCLIAKDYAEFKDPYSLLQALECADFFEQPQLRDALLDYLTEHGDFKGQRLRSHRRDQMYASAIAIELKKNGNNKAAAFRAVAKRAGVETETIKRHYYRKIHNK